MIQFLTRAFRPAPHPVQLPTERPDPFGRFVIVSFYTAGGYYEDKANELRAQCDRFGLAHDIVEITLEPGDDWADICRKKVRFYKQMLDKHHCAIMWLDVDSVLLADIGTLHQGHFDIAMFMRGFKFLPQYNPAMFARTFHPGYLLFRHTPAALQFLNDCLAIDAEHEGYFTDDYILEEAFRTSLARPRLLILSPQDIRRPGDTDREAALFLHGDSGNVDEFKGKVKQHDPRWQSGEVQKAVLAEAVNAAAKEAKRPIAIWLLQRTLKVNPGDFQTLVKLLDILDRAGDAKVLQAELTRAETQEELRPFALRFRLLRALEAHDWTRADALFAEIVATGHTTVIAFCRSRMFRFDLDRRAEAAGIPDEQRASLFWWEEPYPGNLGDIVNPYIVEKISGVPPRHGTKGVGICAIGSIIKFAKTGTPVWGSGSPHEDDELAPDADYRSVRGPYTRDLVIRNGGTCPEVYGDAAWLLPILYRPTIAKTARTGLILHYTHEAAPLIVGDDIRRIGIRRLGYDEIEAFLDEVLSCERIVSSSLHGVIIAQAYGIPAALATVSDSRQQVHGDGIKFRDYFASIGIHHDVTPVDLSRVGPITDASFSPADFIPVPRRINLTALLDAAPFHVRPDLRPAAAAFDAVPVDGLR